ncbi:MAG: hypothetical protein HOL80_02875 [Candidatus Magasanikbacteria bacterium]|jgi:L-ascorbate metabolism protein UlaG (beta-lactamase superfamily)|nr:hypothetical protein [Candidatus Magasanikbacteria bacterium]MBT5262819.1 hypothetical protein [Candidatus Magasanikbacteria bacterium]MBT5820065.1 hypothetical protein [Candidatus Magasanikbacteria bacterium]
MHLLKDNFMHISWLGGTALKIQTKTSGEDVSLFIDPYTPKDGDFLKSTTANIVLYTQGSKGSIPVSGKPFALETAGECEVKNVLIHSVQGHTEKQCFFRLDLEGISLGHLGLCGTPLNPEQLEAFVGVDILCIPVGGEPGFTAEKASACIQKIEPRVVIPIAYLSDNDPNATPVESFIKEIGVPPQDAEKKLVIKKKDLPQEDMQVIVLTK